MPRFRRRPKQAKKGELRAEFARYPWCPPDLVYSWGPGVDGADRIILHAMLHHGKPIFEFSKGLVGHEHNILQQLDEAGYDLTTLEFSIKKKTPRSPNLRELNPNFPSSV